MELSGRGSLCLVLTVLAIPAANAGKCTDTRCRGIAKLCCEGSPYLQNKSTCVGSVTCDSCCGWVDSPYRITLTESPSILVAYPGGTDFQQSQNPSYIPASPVLPHGGLMVRVQNCSIRVEDSSYCSYRKGDGGGGGCYGNSTWPKRWARDHVGYLPFRAGDDGVAPPWVERLTTASIIFGPETPDEEWGTQDPQVSYDPLTKQYYLTYTAWAGPSKGWSVKAAVSANPHLNHWRRLGNVFPNMSKHEYQFVKCGALLTMPKGWSPQYYLYSGDVTSQGAMVSTAERLEGPWSQRKQVLSPREDGWDSNVGCFTPPIRLNSSGSANLLTFYNAFNSYPGSPGFQVGWAVLNGSDPTQVIARGEEPLLRTGMPWTDGTPPYWCNNPAVVFMQSPPQRVKDGEYRLYFGGGGTYVGTARVKVVYDGVQAQD